MQGTQHQVAGERAFDGDLGGLAVADLAHHDHVGVVAEEVPHRRGEGEARRAVDLHLLDAVDAVLHRVLDGEDVDALLGQRLQHGVERGGFAAAGGAADEEQAVVAGDQVVDALAVARAQADLPEVAQALRGVEQADGHALAVDARQHRDAQVDGAAVGQRE